MLQRIITGAAGAVVALCATLAAAAPPALLLAVAVWLWRAPER